MSRRDSVIILTFVGLAYIGVGIVIDQSHKRDLHAATQEFTRLQGSLRRSEEMMAVQGAYYQYSINAYARLSMEEDRARRLGSTDRIIEDGVDVYFAAVESGCLLVVDRVACLKDERGTETFHWVQEGGVLRLDYDFRVDRFIDDMYAAGADVTLVQTYLEDFR